MERTLADAEIRQLFDAQGLEGIGSPPQAFATFVERDAAFIAALARNIESTTNPTGKAP